MPKKAKKPRRRHFQWRVPRGARVTGFAVDIDDAVDERRQKVGVPQFSREKVRER